MEKSAQITQAIDEFTTTLSRLGATALSVTIIGPDAFFSKDLAIHYSPPENLKFRRSQHYNVEAPIKLNVIFVSLD